MDAIDEHIKDDKQHKQKAAALLQGACKIEEETPIAPEDDFAEFIGDELSQTLLSSIHTDSGHHQGVYANVSTDGGWIK